MASPPRSPLPNKVNSKTKILPLEIENPISSPNSASGFTSSVLPVNSADPDATPSRFKREKDEKDISNFPASLKVTGKDRKGLEKKLKNKSDKNVSKIKKATSTAGTIESQRPEDDVQKQ